LKKMSETPASIAEAHVRRIADSTKLLRAMKLDHGDLLLDERNRALLSGAVLLLAWLSVEEAPLVPEESRR
jgi:hypothetical protein